MTKFTEMKKLQKENTKIQNKIDTIFISNLPVELIKKLNLLISELIENELSQEELCTE